MATITTRDEQQSTASAARKVGGYAELVRLSSELQRGEGRTVVRDDDGHWSVKDTAAVAKG